MEYDGDLGVEIFTIFSLAYIIGAAIVGAIRYRWGAKWAVVSLGLGLLVLVAVTVVLAGPLERRSAMSWLSGVAQVFLVFGIFWLVVGSIGVVGGAIARKVIRKQN